MTLAVNENRITVDEFIARADNREHELIDGHLVRRKTMGLRESYIAARIAHMLMQYVEAHNLGFVFAADLYFRCFRSKETLRRADASFIRRGRLSGDRLVGGYATIPADLAVEVVSPTNSAYEVNEKVLEYLTAGFQMVWVCFPNSKTIDIRRPGRPTETLLETDTISGADIIPGFTARVSDLFAVPPEN